MSNPFKKAIEKNGFSIVTKQIKKEDIKTFKRTKNVIFCEQVIEAGVFDEEPEEGCVIVLPVPVDPADKDWKTSNQRGYTMIKIFEDLDPNLAGRLSNKRLKDDDGSLYSAIVLSEVESDEDE